jgi:ribosomal protein S17
MKKDIQKQNNNNTGKFYEGEIINIIDEKTAKVQVVFYKRHLLYARLKRRIQKILVHTPFPVVVGDKVSIKETKKISKRKSFIVLEVIKK